MYRQDTVPLVALLSCERREPGQVQTRKPIRRRDRRWRGLGRGASDLKAGLCTAIEAVRTLDRAGVPLDPTLLFAFVGDEESGEPGTGVSAGARAFADVIRGGEAPKPDMAIYVEPTMLDVYVAHMGFFICDVKVTGKAAYFGTPELGVDALKAAHSVLAALWRYSDELSAGRKHPLVGTGFVLPTGVRGGGYIAVPGECVISLIAKIPPGVELDRVRDGLEAAARAAIEDDRIRLDFSYSASRDHPLGGTPFESALDEARLARLVSAIRAIRPDRGKIEAPHTGRSFPSSPRSEFRGSISRRATSGSATPRKRTSRCRM